jgi:hypothetical protein
MVSIWWVVSVFFLGGVAGMLLWAFLDRAEKNERAARGDVAVTRRHLGPVELDKEWSA